MELTLLLPIVNGTDEDDDENGDRDGDTLDPVNLSFGAGRAAASGRLVRVRRGTEVLVETEGEGDDGGDGKDDEDFILRDRRERVRSR